MKYSIGDKLHISGDITVTGANKCGDGIYSYNTEFGAFHEPALDKLVCKTASVKPQEPKYWSGKVVCVKKANDFLTAGKVYTFKNGKSSDDSGDPFPCFGHIRSIEHLNEIIWSDFIEYKGEAT